MEVKIRYIERQRSLVKELGFENLIDMNLKTLQHDRALVTQPCVTEGPK
jgi:hypothetical protein